MAVCRRPICQRWCLRI